MVCFVGLSAGGFQSTLSMRRATIFSYGSRQPTGISIHALHEESDFVCTVGGISLIISIHALHEESDNRRYGSAGTRCYFNPRSP